MRVHPVATAAQLEDAMRVRFAVFVDEQGVSPEVERDAQDDDPRTVHVIAYADSGEPLGTGRLLAPHTDEFHADHGAMDPATPHIGRLAVVAEARGTGAGRVLMEALHDAARQRYAVDGRVRVELSAQDQAMPFYARLGYVAHGEGYLDEGIPHHDAYVDLTAP
ncbi:GNAT family N-acetyltransferase [Demequina lignilytica]|uniref:GNAT family N-acetyltransferase n=1 Tax=Demequina lignilytica TaxID=3051663 RepID=A0AAW7M5K9_9MICO|nr:MULTISPECIES: GNAT family N-acetyltransferase [unclassified Demequina]MDN4477103.1 GNAT family N-acetyltransferase [Demequina sp. SYSU T00039-1]MDN4483951.1 GNAT family N-acetyltransferase [Demequina sp. SYSU T0a273]MDN4487276.1 GNAT family N-acetyltransferase [Demequina sp. SYSU T00039]MDN4491527.1 GNAT family N-acetyltransferase [Demequina sp. SYSU T00068]